MLSQYFHILLFFVVGLVFPASVMVISALVRERGVKKDNSAYECGMDASGSPWVSPNIRFYFFCLIFVIFDVEALFVFPWAVDFRAFGAAGFAAVMAFVGILLAGLAYAWRKGVLTWE
jgi:NADH:ubiquinone oxidoreductase subunit 3 (subunit A)